MRTFRHLPGIGEITERKLWRSGVLTWDEFEARDHQQLPLFNDERWQSNHPLAASRRALQRRDVGYFVRNLPSSEHFRILLSFPEDALFLDVETTGLSRHYDRITMVGCSREGEYNAWIRGSDPALVIDAVRAAKIVVTFNGSLFDLPFLETEFPDFQRPPCHIDLRYLAQRVGLTGGQKRIEQEIGLERPGLEGLQSADAPVLWYEYTWGSSNAMQKLVAYNRADVQGMRFILDEVLDRFLQQRDFPIDKEAVPRFADSQGLDVLAMGGSDSVEIPPYEGEPGPSITLPELGVVDNFKVVGIDLTGSEDRPSGWCLLDGSEARTTRVTTDDDILAATREVEPDLVSIDSPLSLPAGRTRVDDSDPAREEAGIMRECERLLKQRGINVYPCLIDSMQALTARGIALAQELRAEGVPVIESYPGSAQDIMGIPRKGASEELLRKGLEAFGITGDIRSDSLSHDELDAVTSAVVGVFFWAGRFEALGNTEEEYLIVPSLEDRGWEDRWVVGFSGPIAAGKTTAGELLREKGFAYARFSQVIERIARDRGHSPDRDILQTIGLEVHEERGQRWLGYRLLDLVEDDADVVIDGLRYPEDHAFLVEQFGPCFVHIHLEASRDIRRERYRSQDRSKGDFETADGHAVESDVNKLRPLAHVVVSNEGSVVSLAESIEEALSSADPLIRKG